VCQSFGLLLGTLVMDAKVAQTVRENLGWFKARGHVQLIAPHISMPQAGPMQYARDVRYRLRCGMGACALRHAHAGGNPHRNLAPQ